ncbi:hypothetical protein HY932_03210 [Candidatus Falkowbacteria bacterium]|nr:hypothetical protein [Candidatus Falkowbacteria bacterium]
MFDDPKLQKQSAKFVPPMAGPSEKVPGVEDIFALPKAGSTSPAALSSVPPLAPPLAPPPLAGLARPVASKKGIFIALAIIVLVAILGAAGWFVYDMVITGQSINKGIETLKQTPPAPEVKTEAPKVEQQAVVPAPVVEPEASIVDSDSDGLIDSEELTYGTNPQKADTDDDGLTDKEEVKIYQTDPLNPDTDGDSFIDGVEVKNGYNPNGKGKLLDFEKAKKALQGVE